MKELEYRGKKFTIPTLTKGTEVVPQDNQLPLPDKQYNEIYRSLNKIFNFNNFIDIHQPFSWKMVPRDIEELGLMAYHVDGDLSLRVFPWQNLDGSERTDGFKTRPSLVR